MALEESVAADAVRQPRKSKAQGPLLVALAGILWGTDALFRYPIADSIDPTFIVFCEHLLGVIVLAAWVFARHSGKLFTLSKRGWRAALFVGVGGSAIATAAYTASFRFVNPSVAVLLQKLQPVIVVAIAYVVLGEKPDKKFYLWSAVALAAGLVLSFPDMKFDLSNSEAGNHMRGTLLALCAAVLWAASTVAGKVMLYDAYPSVGTFWRYFFGMIAMALVIVLMGVPIKSSFAASKHAAASIVYLALLAGILPMAFYYAGLKRTSASITTFVELLYPVSAVILNTVFLHTPLSAVQMVAGTILLFAVTRISS